MLHKYKYTMIDGHTPYKDRKLIFIFKIDLF